MSEKSKNIWKVKQKIGLNPKKIYYEAISANINRETYVEYYEYWVKASNNIISVNIIERYMQVGWKIHGNWYLNNNFEI